MANHASHAALPYPVKGARYTVLIPYLDADGDPTDPTTPDTEISKDDGAAADTAEEVSSPKNSVGMLTLTGAEMDCSAASLAAKAASGPKSTLMTLFPRTLPKISNGTLSAGSAGGGTLGTVLGYDIRGAIIKTTGGTGGGGTGGANNQARVIDTYNVGTGAFTVVPDWETAPSTDTTYDILFTELCAIAAIANVQSFGGVAGTFSGGRPEVNTSHAAGTAWNSGAIGPNALASDTITAAKIADGALTAAKFAAGAFDAVWSVATRTLTAISDSSGITTLLGKLAGITLLSEWLGLIAGKQVGNTTARNELRATGAGSGTFDETTDSQEAIRDNMGTPQTGDSFARIGATGSGLTSLAPAATALSTAQWSNARAGYLDNLSAGAVALDSTVAKAAAVAALNNLSQAQSQAAAEAALAAFGAATVAMFTTTTRSDPAALGASLASALTPFEKLDWIAARVLRENTFNKTTGDLVVKNAAGTDIASATCSDDGTTTTRPQLGAP